MVTSCVSGLLQESHVCIMMITMVYFSVATKLVSLKVNNAHNAL